jgi:hypothetical protein
MLVVLAVAALTAVAAPASADMRRAGGGQSSVFPTPRDPWKSWGVRKELPHRVGPAREHAHGRHQEHAPQGHGTVWVPGHWAWNGHTWVWWPGHWGVR